MENDRVTDDLATLAQRLLAQLPPVVFELTVTDGESWGRAQRPDGDGIVKVTVAREWCEPWLKPTA